MKYIKENWKLLLILAVLIAIFLVTPLGQAVLALFSVYTAGAFVAKFLFSLLLPYMPTWLPFLAEIMSSLVVAAVAVIAEAVMFLLCKVVGNIFKNCAKKFSSAEEKEEPAVGNKQGDRPNADSENAKEQTLIVKNMSEEGPNDFEKIRLLLCEISRALVNAETHENQNNDSLEQAPKKIETQSSQNENANETFQEESKKELEELKNLVESTIDEVKSLLKNHQNKQNPDEIQKMVKEKMSPALSKCKELLLKYHSDKTAGTVSQTLSHEATKPLIEVYKELKNFIQNFDQIIGLQPSEWFTKLRKEMEEIRKEMGEMDKILNELKRRQEERNRQIHGIRDGVETILNTNLIASKEVQDSQQSTNQNQQDIEKLKKDVEKAKENNEEIQKMVEVVKTQIEKKQQESQQKAVIEAKTKEILNEFKETMEDCVEKVKFLFTHSLALIKAENPLEQAPKKAETQPSQGSNANEAFQNEIERELKELNIRVDSIIDEAKIFIEGNQNNLNADNIQKIVKEKMNPALSHCRQLLCKYHDRHDGKPTQALTHEATKELIELFKRMKSFIQNFGPIIGQNQPNSFTKWQEETEERMEKIIKELIVKMEEKFGKKFSETDEILSELKTQIEEGNDQLREVQENNKKDSKQLAIVAQGIKEHQQREKKLDELLKKDKKKNGDLAKSAAQKKPKAVTTSNIFEEKDAVDFERRLSDLLKSANKIIKRIKKLNYSDMLEEARDETKNEFDFGRLIGYASKCIFNLLHLIKEPNPNPEIEKMKPQLVSILEKACGITTTDSSLTLESRINQIETRFELYIPPSLKLDDFKFNQNDLLGKGGYAKVYKGYKRGDHTDHTDHTVALKRNLTLSELLSERPGEKPRDLSFEIYIQFHILKTLQKKSNEKEDQEFKDKIPQVFGVICINTNEAYLAMSFLDERNVRQFIGRTDFPPDIFEEVFRNRGSIAGQLLSLVAYLHKKGIIHGDINPRNLVLKRMEDGFILQICDFGNATTTKNQRPFLGTTAFTAPEAEKDPKVEGDFKWVTMLTDVYAALATFLDLVLVFPIVEELGKTPESRALLRNSIINEQKIYFSDKKIQLSKNIASFIASGLGTPRKTAKEMKENFEKEGIENEINNLKPPVLGNRPA